jgi:hypothetical protein
MLIVGPPGIGKTSLLRTLKATSTLFVDAEAGDLAVQDLHVDTIRIDDWDTARNLACRVGGPNPSFPPTACYSPAHYEAVGAARWGYPAKDRAGRLEPIEKPDLGELIAKLIVPGTRKPFAISPISTEQALKQQE